MEYLTTLGILPLAFIYGLKHTRLKIPSILAQLSPLVLAGAEMYFGLGYKTIGMHAAASACGLFIGQQSQFYVLTGSIACGKSTVLNYVQNHFANKVGLIDSDVLARVVVMPGKPAHREIINRFGESILKEDNEIDREKLGKLIFANQAERRALTAITTKYIMWEIVKEHIALRIKGYKHILIDMPIFFEIGGPLSIFPSKIIVVHVKDEEVWVSRLMARDGISKEEAQTKINAQMPIALKLAKCDSALDNSGDLDYIESQTHKLFSNL